MSTTVADAEDDIRSAQGTFDSIQPPDAASDRLRSQLDDILGFATDEITELRVEARWTDIETMVQAVRNLDVLAADLEGFLRQHR